MFFFFLCDFSLGIVWLLANTPIHFAAECHLAYTFVQVVVSQMGYAPELLDFWLADFLKFYGLRQICVSQSQIHTTKSTNIFV